MPATKLVKVNNGCYLVPSKVLTGARRIFKRVKAKQTGLHIDAVRAYLGEKLVWGSVKITYARSPHETVAWYDATKVADRLGEQLVRKWTREGYIERVGYGIYRLVSA